MKPGNAIEVNNITKSFKVYLDKGGTLKEKVIFKNRRRFEERQVLKGISFEVKKGEAIGLIGHNGCGKSTTLKLLTKIMYPDSGTIEMNGRVSSLIELGAGFHPDMSGRENIYINASIFGLTRKEIDERIEDIIAFSELEEFIDNPVRTYSSGMYMRLAFSVAINVDADILLIDEILAVGDANFQAKCFNKLKEVKANGTTIVIVSHSLGQIEQICERSIWIDKGFIREEGSPRDVHPAYLDYMGRKREEIANKEMQRKQGKKEREEQERIEEEKRRAEQRRIEEQKRLEEQKAEQQRQQEQQRLEEQQLLEEQKRQEEELRRIEEEKQKKRWGNGKARIKEVELFNAKGEKAYVYAVEDSMQILMKYQVKDKVEDAVFGIGFFRNDGLQVYGTNTRIDKFERFDLDKDGVLRVNIQRIGLLSGKYKLDIAIESGEGIPVDYYREAAEFEVFSVNEDVGVSRVEHKWDF